MKTIPKPDTTSLHRTDQAKHRKLQRKDHPQRHILHHWPFPCSQPEVQRWPSGRATAPQQPGLQLWCTPHGWFKLALQGQIEAWPFSLTSCKSELSPCLHGYRQLRRASLMTAQPKRQRLNSLSHVPQQPPAGKCHSLRCRALPVPA